MLTVPATFNSQPVRISISYDAQLLQTCSRHSRLLDSAYFYFISSTIIADKFLSLPTLSQYVFPLHKQCNYIADKFSPL